MEKENVTKTEKRHWHTEWKVLEDYKHWLK